MELYPNTLSIATCLPVMDSPQLGEEINIGNHIPQKGH
jgi:hypothetical protein